MPLSRRQFLTLMGASLALAGLSGCSVQPAPSGELVPYVHPPEEVVPGKPLFFATAMTLGGAAVGLLVESHMGRPTKIEGNPDHPASRGATDLYHQASVLTLYDPDRAQTVTHLGPNAHLGRSPRRDPRGLESSAPSRGAGLRLLTETVVSPTLARQIDDLLKDLPEAKWHVWEPIAPRRGLARGADGIRRSRSMPFTISARPTWCCRWTPTSLHAARAISRYAADFMDRRRVRTTPHDAGRGRDEPAVRGGNGRQLHGGQGRSSPGAAARGEIERFAAAGGREAGHCRRQATPPAAWPRTGSPPWPRICRPIAAARWCWPAIGSRPSCICWRTR